MIFLIYVFLTLAAVVLIYDEIENFINKNVKSTFWRKFWKILAMFFALFIFFIGFFYICLKY
jgi:hypothetical protein